jgi:hypothetical protein
VKVINSTVFFLYVVPRHTIERARVVGFGSKEVIDVSIKSFPDWGRG